MNKKLIVIISLILAGCGSSKYEDLEKWMKTTRLTQKGKIKPLPTPKVVVPTPFIAKNDPFVLKQITTVNSDNNKYAPNPDRRKEPLEAFRLDTLKMVGILIKKNKTYAMILAPDNTINYVSKDNYIGTNYGKIVEINDGLITLDERIKNNEDQWEPKKTTIYMQDK